jgi:hypothetical protein
MFLAKLHKQIGNSLQMNYCRNGAAEGKATNPTLCERQFRTLGPLHAKNNSEGAVWLLEKELSGFFNKSGNFPKLANQNSSNIKFDGQCAINGSIVWDL